MSLVRHRTALAAAVASSMLLAAPALADDVSPAAISVTGEATLSVAPDQAEIEAGVTSEAKTARGCPRPTMRRWARCYWR